MDQNFCVVFRDITYDRLFSSTDLYRHDAHGKFFDDPFLKYRIEFSVKGDTCVLLGVKGLITILNILLIAMQNVLHLLFKYIKIEKYNYFLKYLKRYPQYGGQEKYKHINIYTTAIIICGGLLMMSLCRWNVQIKYSLCPFIPNLIIIINRPSIAQ